jgi:hypothetical protein
MDQKLFTTVWSEDERVVPDVCHDFYSCLNLMDPHNPQHLLWLEKLMQLLMFCDRALLTTETLHRRRLYEHMRTIPTRTSATVFRDRCDVSYAMDRVGKVLHWYRFVRVPTLDSAATFIKACWKGYRVRRAMLDPELPHNKRRIMQEYDEFSQLIKRHRTV